MKKTKRIISMILAVIMLSMTAIGVNAEELIVGFDDLLEAVGIIEHDHEEEELMPMAVNEKCGHVHSDSCYQPVKVTVKCKIDYFYGNQPTCTAGESPCWGNKHPITETWYQLTCGYN